RRLTADTKGAGMIAPTDSALTTKLDLTGRVAIVTGGGTGIGAATARLLAAHGASVVVAGRTPELLERVCEDIRERSRPACLAVPTNVRLEGDIDALVARTLAEFGRIDV